MITVKDKVVFTRGRCGERKIRAGAAQAVKATVGRIPRISKLMALAIRYDRLLREGVVSDSAELARLAKVTQPRITQILNLLHLAPGHSGRAATSAASDGRQGPDHRTSI